MINPGQLELRPAVLSDLDHFFVFQLDVEANRMAAFTSKDPTDKAAYLEKYGRLLADPTVNQQTILVNGTIVGSVAKFIMHGEASVSYWIDKKFWGQGITTEALKQFLHLEKTRPVFGRVAFDNPASQKVMEKNGFQRIGTDRGFANARQTEIEEFIYKLA